MVENLSPHPLSILPFPGALSSLLHKRVYTHANADATPEASADFTYAYDAVGNV
ncbi:MAG: hypothetical protein HUU16_11920, partial [Candidatus Omnitrophica bacterium]|nr:hypothetical protein [Candidatus Omnitrophota bacterium]